MSWRSCGSWGYAVQRVRDCSRNTIYSFDFLKSSFWRSIVLLLVEWKIQFTWIIGTDIFHGDIVCNEDEIYSWASTSIDRRHWALGIKEHVCFKDSRRRDFEPCIEPENTSSLSVLWLLSYDRGYIKRSTTKSVLGHQI